VKLEFRRAELEPAPGLTEATVAGTTDKVYLHKTSDATNEDVADVRASEDIEKNPAIDVAFTKAGARKMARLSEEHKGKPLAILVDGKVITAPRIAATFSERAMLTGRFTRDEVEKLVRAINGE
jgi:preprotein translocase subunit SecD